MRWSSSLKVTRGNTGRTRRKAHCGRSCAILESGLSASVRVVPSVQSTYCSCISQTHFSFCAATALLRPTCDFFPSTLTTLTCPVRDFQVVWSFDDPVQYKGSIIRLVWQQKLPGSVSKLHKSAAHAVAIRRRYKNKHANLNGNLKLLFWIKTLLTVPVTLLDCSHSNCCNLQKVESVHQRICMCSSLLRVGRHVTTRGDEGCPNGFDPGKYADGYTKIHLVKQKLVFTLKQHELRRSKW